VDVPLTAYAETALVRLRPWHWMAVESRWGRGPSARTLLVQWAHSLEAEACGMQKACCGPRFNLSHPCSCPDACRCRFALVIVVGLAAAVFALVVILGLAALVVVPVAVAAVVLSLG
jgi:hypothetical protein